MTYIQAGRRLQMSGQDGLEKALDALQKAADQASRTSEIISRLRQFLSKGEPEHRTEDLPKAIEEATALSMVGTRNQGVTLVSISTAGRGWS